MNPRETLQWGKDALSRGLFGVVVKPKMHAERITLLLRDLELAVCFGVHRKEILADGGSYKRRELAEEDIGEDRP